MKTISDTIKKVVKPFCPPILPSTYRYLLQFLNKKRNSEQEEFEPWWKGFSSKKALPYDLVSMVDYFVTTPSYKASSKYWHWLNRRNIQQIVNHGYENFKQTVARNYFTWVGGLDTDYAQNLLKESKDIKINIPLKEILKKHTDFGPQESVLYNIITVLLLDYVRKNGGSKYVDMLEEPLEGNPPFLNFQGKRISQDILNSILEYISISSGCDIAKISSILEIGAGSGRTAFCLLKLLPDVKYIVVDIPPALFISQTYLSNTFKNKKIFSFRPFKSFMELEDEFKASDVIFLMPDQLDLLPEKIADLFLAIDCLHEMKKEQVQLYFNHVDRLASYFFFKCWQKTTVPFDGITYSSEDYPIKENWNKVYKRVCKVPAAYFEAFYEIN
ncbi:MAG: putative sugar O-methyltransferase [Desulfobacteraceae bacterium]|nr:putative sugar O-methyltransferase [Desulfobacteraceae bacterium]